MHVASVPGLPRSRARFNYAHAYAANIRRTGKMPGLRHHVRVDVGRRLEVWHECLPLTHAHN